MLCSHWSRFFLLTVVQVFGVDPPRGVTSLAASGSSFEQGNGLKNDARRSPRLVLGDSLFFFLLHVTSET